MSKEGFEPIDCQVTCPHSFKCYRRYPDDHQQHLFEDHCGHQEQVE